MSRRYPKGKGSRTMTARAVDAMATDMENFAKGLHQVAEEYRQSDSDVHSLADQVDGIIGLTLGLFRMWRGYH